MEGGDATPMASVRKCKCAKVGRKNKGTSGRVDWWERDEQEMQCKSAKVQRWKSETRGRGKR